MPPKPTTTFRLVVWNANQAGAHKLAALARLSPDLAIVPECGDAATLRRWLRGSHVFTSMAWVGRNPLKGLAVLGFDDTEVALHPSFDPRLQWVAPVTVAGSVELNLLAVWAYNRRATEFHPMEPRTSQAHQLLVVYRDLLDAGPTVVAGDFNNNVTWDKPHLSFAALVNAYEDVGLVSAYHRVHGAEYGKERDPTIYWRTRAADGARYHIDYCFVPTPWLSAIRGVYVGSHADWVATGLSDHVPLVVDVAVDVLSQ